ncbi:MAG: thioredoxin family protein [Gammaproteobacteria bacterium]
MTDNIIHVTKANFDQTIGKHPILLLDFWGQTCAPCHTFSKVLEEVAPDYPDITFAKINTDTEFELAQEFQIRSIPFIMIMRENVVVYADSGALPDSVLREMLEQVKALDMNEVRKQIANEDK